jgi:DNA invertase Pin-like site-specific DNA recombinase
VPRACALVVGHEGVGDALTAAGCQRIFVDKVSGELEHRPVLDAMLEQVRPGDSVTVWRLDRLGRSLRHLIDTVADLEAGGGGLPFPDREHRHVNPRGQADVPPLWCPRGV